jgi:beta-phosphoglucomutase
VRFRTHHDFLMSAPQTMPLRAVCFDFDGVIADTENIHVAAWQRTLASLGQETSDEVCARAVEVDDRKFLTEFFTQRGIEDGNVEGWVRRKQELTVALLTDSPRLFPGVLDLVKKIQGKVRLAVVSTTWRENILVVLKASGLSDAFETIVGKEDVQAVKPDPEAYQLALKRLGVAPKEAVALEDSVSGLTAARMAGLPTIAIGHRLGKGDWVGSSPYLDDFRRLPQALALLGLEDPSSR